VEEAGVIVAEVEEAEEHHTVATEVAEEDRPEEVHHPVVEEAVLHQAVAGLEEEVSDLCLVKK